MPPRKTVHDHDGGELRGHGRAVPHARAGRPVPRLAGPAGPHHLPLPAHAALLVVSILPKGSASDASASTFERPCAPTPGRRQMKHVTWTPVPQTSLKFQLLFYKGVCLSLSFF